MQIKNSTTLITGGASGLGHATAQALVERGGRVLIIDLNQEQGQAAAQALGDAALFVQADVTDEAQIQSAIDQAVEQFGRLDVCVNCAGIGSANKTVDREGAPHPLDGFEKVIQINLIGSFNVGRLAAAAMAKNAPIDADGQRGLIVNTASVAAFDGQLGQAAYSASKGGIVGMTLPMARDLASLGIRCNTIAPGIFSTPLMNGMPDKVKEPLVAMTQFPKRLGHPEEYARMVVTLIENDFMNGETLRLDGAIRMQPR
ncbi:3-hydroxyacyl-CoA dehydrogenase [gamma proteobacterium HTCC5015]|nr:3-hydroxyacyl-CoA dehydrogenase [gamma proteobacterium HTCC5015]